MSFQGVVPSVSLITLVKAGVPNGTATGFFYKRGDKLFLVTNNHVAEMRAILRTLPFPTFSG